MPDLQAPRRPLTRDALRKLRELHRQNPPSDQQPPKEFGFQHHHPALSAAEVFDRLDPEDQAQVQRSARGGGPDLRGLRGYWPLSNPEMDEQLPPPGRHGRALRSIARNNALRGHVVTITRARDGHVPRQSLIDNGVFPPGYEYPDGDELPEPHNIDEIREALGQSRRSVSPSRFSREDLKRFERANAHAVNEPSLGMFVVPTIQGDPGDLRCMAAGVPFLNLDPLAGGLTIVPTPSIYHGAIPEQLDTRIRTELEGYIMPSVQSQDPVVPNNFLVFKGDDVPVKELTMQATYCAAFGARGIRSLQSHGATDQPFDNKAYTLAWTYCEGVLRAYASHPIQPSSPGSQPSYATTLLDTFTLTANPEAFRQGLAAYRNGRDWAKNQRDQAIAHANANANAAKSAAKSTAIAPAQDRQNEQDDQNDQNERDEQGKVPRSRNENPAEGASQGVTKRRMPASHHDDRDTSEDEPSLQLERPAKRPRVKTRQATRGGTRAKSARG